MVAGPRFEPTNLCRSALGLCPSWAISFPPVRKEHTVVSRRYGMWWSSDSNPVRHAQQAATAVPITVVPGTDYVVPIASLIAAHSALRWRFTAPVVRSVVLFASESSASFAFERQQTAKITCLIPGAPDTIRTCGLYLRRVALYPAELRVHLLLTQCLRRFLASLK